MIELAAVVMVVTKGDAPDIFSHITPHFERSHGVLKYSYNNVTART